MYNQSLRLGVGFEAACDNFLGLSCFSECSNSMVMPVLMSLPHAAFEDVTALEIGDICRQILKGDPVDQRTSLP